MNTALTSPCTAFDGHRLLATGTLPEVALAVQAAADRGAAGPLLVFDDRSGRLIDVDLRGSAQDLLDRLTPLASDAAPAASAPTDDASAAVPDQAADSDTPRGRGRPRLGVVAREVTLLPRHWDWLTSQTGGASVALRKLVETARRDGAERDARRRAQEAAYHVMSTLAGNLAGFEEASRALFANDSVAWQACMADWPQDLREHLLRLAEPS